MDEPPQVPNEQASSLGNVLVTGATGQIGRRLVSTLLEHGNRVIVLARSPNRASRLWSNQLPLSLLEVRVGDLTRPDSLGTVCEDVDTLFHLASHTPPKGTLNPDDSPSHWAMTALGTSNLMARVADSSIRQVIFFSSTKAMGERLGTSGQPCDESTPPQPQTRYGQAKLAAESSVLSLARQGVCHVSVLRLPMVYGLEDGGNLARLVDTIVKGRMPPWPAVHHRRSAVHVDDAIAAALLAARYPERADGVLLVTDGRAYSTYWIDRQVRRALGRPPPRWSMPLGLLRAAAAIGSLAECLTGRRMPITLKTLVKLTDDAWFSSARLEQRLGFRASHSMEHDIERLTARYPRPTISQ